MCQETCQTAKGGNNSATFGAFTSGANAYGT